MLTGFIGAVLLGGALASDGKSHREIWAPLHRTYTSGRIAKALKLSRDRQCHLALKELRDAGMEFAKAEAHEESARQSEGSGETPLYLHMWHGKETKKVYRALKRAELAIMRRCVRKDWSD